MANKNIKETQKPTAKGWKAQVAQATMMEEFKLPDGRYNWEAIYELVHKDKELKELTKEQVKAKIRKWFNGNPKLVSELRSTPVDKPAKQSRQARKAVAAREEIEKKEKSIDEIVENTEKRVTERGKTAKGDFSATIEALVNPNDPIDSPEFALKLGGYDPELWELKSLRIAESNWQAQRKGGEIVTLVAKKFALTVAPRNENVSLETMRKNFLESVVDYAPAPVKPMVVEGNHLAVLSIADLHLGKLSWGPETGENYDHYIATERFRLIVDTAIHELKIQAKLGRPVERIILYWSQDFFHFDNMEATTTAGTKQDADVRLPKMYKLGCDLLIEALQKLSKIAPVETFWVRSNHDTITGYQACLHLAAYFHNNPNVIIDESPFPRKYRRYGITELGFAHGDKEGNRISHCMQNDAEGKKYWSECDIHEFFLGHFHSEQSRDIAGVLCRYLGSPTSADYWTNTSGFVGAQKKSQLFVYNKNEGLIYYRSINIPKTSE